MIANHQRSILPFIIFLFSLSASQAQLLNNTRWRSYDDQDHFDLFWNFNNDTVATSTDNVSWNQVSVYAEAGNILTFRDILPVYCNTDDVGVYQFSLQLDTLRLTELNEPCASRSDYLTTHYFVDFPIGINDLENFREVEIYPLPFSDVLNIKTPGSFEFALLDITGRKVIADSFQDRLLTDTKKLEPGMYVYELRSGDNFVKSGTVVKY